MTSIQVENEDQLIERVTEIIGNNLFPDNFGIMLLNEKEGFLYPHSSYRLYKTEKLVFNEIPLGRGSPAMSRRTGSLSAQGTYGTWNIISIWTRTPAQSSVFPSGSRIASWE
jgi:hypothetical protein